MTKILNFRDLTFMLIGILLGITFIFLWFYAFGFQFLDYMSIDTIILDLNESKIIDLMYKKINQTIT